MKTSSLERKDPDVFWIRVRFLVKVDLQYIPFLLNWCSWMTTLSNLKTYLPFALKHLFGCHFLYVLNWKSSYDVIAKYYVYHGFELKAFEERHIRIMHNVRDYSVFYNIALRPTVCEGSYFTHMWKTLAWPHHVTKSLTTPPLIVVHVSSYESGWSCIWV
jgi:hypothetical protein